MDARLEGVTYETQDHQVAEQSFDDGAVVVVAVDLHKLSQVHQNYQLEDQTEHFPCVGVVYLKDQMEVVAGLTQSQGAKHLSYLVGLLVGRFEVRKVHRAQRALLRNQINGRSAAIHINR